MALTGAAKAAYQREYHARRKSETRVMTCNFCDEPGSADRLLVGDPNCCAICEACITLAVARINEARGVGREDGLP